MKVTKSMLVVVSLSFCMLANAQMFGPRGMNLNKKPLDHDVYDGWQSVRSVSLSNDGKLISWQVAPQDGDATLYLRNLETGKEISVERGSALTIGKSADYATFTIAVPSAVKRQAKIDKKKPDEMPKDTLAYINLKTFEITRLEGASGAKTGFDAVPYIAASYTSKDKKAGKSAIVVNTATGKVDTLKGVSSFAFSKDGLRLAAITEKDKKDSLSESSVVYYKLAEGTSEKLSTGLKAYSGLAFNNEGDKLVFLATDQEEKTDGTPGYSVYLTSEKTIKKAARKTPAVKSLVTEELIAQGSDLLPQGWVIGKNSRPRFSNKSSRIILSLAEYFPAKDTTVYDFESAQLDIWRWDSQTVPPNYKASSGGARMNRTRTAMIELKGTPSFIVLSQNSNDHVSFGPGAESDFAVSTDSEKYILDNMFARDEKMDVSLVDLKSGSRTLLAEGFSSYGSLSDNGKYFYWFSSDDGQFHTRNVATGQEVDLTSKLGVDFFDDSVDTPSGYSPYSRRPVWLGNDEYILLCDRYDIWKLSPDGTRAENLTKGAGRRDGIQYRYTELVRESDPYLYEVIKPVGLKDDIYLTTFEEKTKKNGFAKINVAAPAEPVGFTAEKTFTNTVRAHDANVFAYLKGDFRNPYDLYVSHDNFVTEQQLSAINPQQREYNWGNVQLVHWDAYDGTKLDGMLFTPENLDRSKKYPMMIYFYEKNSETLFSYRAPAPSRSIINITFFTSRGYVVFVPDVVYTVGHPGESAYNCICSGAEAMCNQFSFINKDKMAIQGQSWGGYQTAYLVTRTDMFAAGGAGAPVGNMTSAYGGIRWESGNSRITQYEYGQSRIGKSLWDEGGLDLYIENSPVFFAPKVKTPVLIMHNDADGAVPWYQGIEFFMSLRRLGKPAWLLEYNNEAHNLLERRNCKDLSIRLSQFFDHYLQDAPMPVWMKSGIPYERKGNYYAYELAE